MTIIRNRVIAATTAAAIALTSVAFTPAMAAAPVSKKQPEASQSTDFSAQRRHRRYSRGNAAAGAAILGIIGAVGTYAAAREYRRAHERRYYYGGYDGGYYGHRSYYGHPGYGAAPYGYYRY